MIIRQQLNVLVMASALVLTACSSTPTSDSGRHSLYGRQNQQTAQVEEDEAVVGKLATKDGYNESESADFVKTAQFAADNKCVGSKPIGGVEQHFFFDFDKDAVSSADIKAIKTECDYLLRHPNALVRVEGNADDRGSREYNVALAARRANAVIRIMKQQGVSGKQIRMVSYGAEKPAALGENAEAYHCNRRVDIVFEVG